MKTCFKCLKNKSLEDFYHHKGMSDGFLNKCKTCVKEDTNKRIQFLKKNNPEWVEKEIVRHRTKATRYRLELKPINKEKLNQAKRKWSLKNKQKKKANLQVNRAIKSGKFSKQACEKCGCLEVEAHHDDYSKPLDVRWLCIKHHNEYHNLKRKELRILKNENN